MIYKRSILAPCNKLTLNIKRTNYLIIPSNYRLNQMKHNFEININDQSLSRVGSYGYLGIEVAETLIWQTQVDTTVKKVSAGLGVLNRFAILYPAKH